MMEKDAEQYRAEMEKRYKEYNDKDISFNQVVIVEGKKGHTFIVGKYENKERVEEAQNAPFWRDTAYDKSEKELFCMEFMKGEIHGLPLTLRAESRSSYEHHSYSKDGDETYNKGGVTDLQIYAGKRLFAYDTVDRDYKGNLLYTGESTLQSIGDKYRWDSYKDTSLHDVYGGNLSRSSSALDNDRRPVYDTHVMLRRIESGFRDVTDSKVLKDMIENEIRDNTKEALEKGGMSEIKRRAKMLTEVFSRYVEPMTEGERIVQHEAERPKRVKKFGELRKKILKKRGELDAWQEKQAIKAQMMGVENKFSR